MSDGQTIFVVDDDETVRGSLRWLLESLKFDVQTFASARDFLSAHGSDPSGCLILDVRMPDISGLQLQEILVQQRIRIPVIMITGHGDISMAVHAMKAGAFDFIEKPFKDQVLLDRTQEALEADHRRRCDEEERRRIVERLSRLTAREGEVLEKILDGMPNKTIAEVLGISMKTVEVHRARVMEKMAVNSVAELTALCMTAGRRKGKP